MDTQPQKHSQKKYFLLVVDGSSENSVRRIRLNGRKMRRLLLAAFLLFLFLFCYFLFATIFIHHIRRISAAQKLQIAALNEENASLSSNRAELEAQVATLSNAVNYHREETQEAEAAARERRLPAGFPVSGSASMTDTYDDPNATSITESSAGNPIVIFTVSEGDQILSAGDGTVTVLINDVKYGHCVMIDHGNGYLSIYRHGSVPLVKEEQNVQRGDTLFIVDGSHSKFGYQIQYEDAFIDPETMIDVSG